MLEQGGALIIAEVDDDKADAALEDHAQVRGADPGGPAGAERQPGQAQGKQTEKAQVIEEELEVGKSATTGGKRLKTEVSEREVEETVAR